MLKEIHQEFVNQFLGQHDLLWTLQRRRRSILKVENEFFISRNFWGTQIWLKWVGLWNREETTTTNLTMLLLLFPSYIICFGDELNRYSEMAHADIWAHENLKQIFGYIKLRFHNELLRWEKNCFLVFFRAGLHLHVRKISTFSVKQFKFFAKISYILDN